jgi:regulator of sigma E protease
MNILIMVGQLILGLSILVILHELGHFVAARAFGIKVEKFYLFFDAWNFSLFKFNYKGVEYGIGWLPLGGYVKIAGMIDESMDTEQLAGPPQPWEFRSKPAWQRLIVMLAGIFVNVVLGIFIFWMLTAHYGESYTPNQEVKYGIVPGTIGQKIGLKAGDQIYAINGKPIEKFEDLTSSNVLLDQSVLNIHRGNKDTSVVIPKGILNDIADQGLDQFISRIPRTTFHVDSVSPVAKSAGLRKGDSIIAVNSKPVLFFDQIKSVLDSNKNKQANITVVRNNAAVNLSVKISKEGTIGFYPHLNLPKQKTINFGFFGSLPVGATRAWTTIADDAKGLGKVFKGDVKPNKAISGPIAIATMFGSEIDWFRFWSLVGVLSMILAFTNLLPIPALDGGHSLFLLIEMIKGKPLSDKFLERAQIVGFVLLVTLMVFVFGNDTIRVFFKK